MCKVPDGVKDKYTFTGESKINEKGKQLCRIKALISFGDVKAGDIGGWVEGMHNLSHAGNCWIYDESEVFENARVEDSAIVRRNSKVYGLAEVKGKSTVTASEIIGARVLYAQVTRSYVRNARLFNEVGIHDSKINIISPDYIDISGGILLRNAKITNQHDIIHIKGIGTGDLLHREPRVDAYRSETGVLVRCNKFLGTIDEFVNKFPDDVHMKLAELFKIHFGVN